MKKIVFGLLGLLLPILVGLWLDGFLSSMNGILAPLGMMLAGPALIVIFALPLIIWSIIASIYGLKNKPVVNAYTIGMIVGIILAFTIIPNLDIIKTYF